MAKPSKPLHCDEVPCASATMAQTVERRDSCTENGRGFHGRQGVGDGCHRFALGDHILRVAAIFIESGDLKILTTHEVSPSAWHTLPAMSAVPPDTGALALLPDGHAWTYGINHAGHFMPCHARVLKSWPVPLFGERIAMAHTTGLDLDANGVRTWLRHRTFDHLEWSSGTFYLHGRHL